MNWNSLEEFLHMGGAGLYVWGSYLMVLVLMVAEPVLTALRHREAKEALVRHLEDKELTS